MNERIRELYLHAFPPSLNDSTVCQMSAEKFAEAIVQECLMKAIGAKIRGESIDTLIQNIKEDFGVE